MLENLSSSAKQWVRQKYEKALPILIREGLILALGVSSGVYLVNKYDKLRRPAVELTPVCDENQKTQIFEIKSNGQFKISGPHMEVPLTFSSGRLFSQTGNFSIRGQVDQMTILDLNEKSSLDAYDESLPKITTPITNTDQILTEVACPGQ